MTLVNHETGELLERLTESEAERLTTRISLKLDAMADTYVGVMPLIREAINREAYSALGYRSVGEYISDRFGGSLAKLGMDVRREVVHELANAGMSTRAIAPVVGAGKSTVERDLQVSHVGHLMQTPVASASGSTPARPETPQVAPDERTDTAAAVLGSDDSTATTPRDGTPAPTRPAVVGLDGKTYTRPEPKAPRPVMSADEAEYDNAVQASKALARSVSKLLEFQHPNMRDAMREYWSTASIEVPPTPRRDVTPEQMRVAAHGLLTLADEWDS